MMRCSVSRLLSVVLLAELCSRRAQDKSIVRSHRFSFAPLRPRYPARAHGHSNRVQKADAGARDAALHGAGQRRHVARRFDS